MPSENKLVRYWRLIYPLGLHFILTNVIAVLVMILLVFLNGMKNPTLSYEDLMLIINDIYSENGLLLTFLSSLGTFPFLLFFMGKDKKRKKSIDVFKTYESAPLWGYGILILLGIFSCIGANTLIALSGLSEIFKGYNKVAEVLYQSNIPFEILAIGIVTPLVEETLFRGLIFQRARESFGFSISLFLSAAIFGIFHFNVVQGIYAFVLGLVFGYAYDQFKSLWAPIILHISANCVAVAISETDIFTPIYENDVPFLILTGISIIMTIGTLLLIKQFINLKEVKA